MSSGRTIQEIYARGREILEAAGIEDGALDAWYLLEWVTGIPRAQYYAYPDRELSADHREQYLAGIARRSRRIPLQHITGEQEFMGLGFKVSPDVLIPRQDTEILVECGLEKLAPGMEVLDMCTGSGCIIISLEQWGKRKGKADDTNSFTGSDISAGALEIARENGKLHGAKVQFRESDLFDSIEGTYDMIISNPPYIRSAVIKGLQEEVRCHDPYIALDGKEDGLYFYKRIITESRRFLKPGGWLLFETGHDQRTAVASLMEEAGYKEITWKKDLAGLDRVTAGRYTLEIAGGKDRYV